MRSVWLQLRAARLVLVTQVLLPRRGTTATLRRLHAGGRDGRRVDPGAATRAVQRAGRVVRARCLAQSVALATLLSESGEDAVVVLGCRLYGDRGWGSHAWVRCGEDVLEPVVAEDHAELARYSAATDWVPVASPPPATGIR